MDRYFSKYHHIIINLCRYSINTLYLRVYNAAMYFIEYQLAVTIFIFVTVMTVFFPDIFKDRHDTLQRK